jgi:hypothetical protein
MDKDKNQYIVIPVTEKNRSGVDDILDAAKTFFGSETTTCDAIIVETSNPGMAVLANALAERSGTQEGMRKAMSKRSPRKNGKIPQKVAAEEATYESAYEAQ